MKRRGARFLPTLAEADLRVLPEELEAFVGEVRALLADVEALTAEVPYDAEYVSVRLRNFLHAAGIAAERGGGVSID